MRMARALFSLFAALSLLLCLAALAAWSNSSILPKLVKLSDGPAGGSSVSVDAGRVSYFHIAFTVEPNMARMLRDAVQPGIGGRPWRNGGFDLKWRVPLTTTGGGKTSTIGEWTVVSVPFWAIAAASAVAPAAWLLRHFTARHRRRARLCPSCGYDVRLTPDRCPECGARPEAGEARPVGSR